MTSLIGITHIYILVIVCNAGHSFRSEHINSNIGIIGGPQEYCLVDENFSPKCLMRNEIIVMISALYGRMRAGRCLEGEELEMGAFVSDPRILGCSVDVLQIMDRKCSGRQMCEIRSADADLRRERPCNKALKNYLEADFACVTVIEEDRSCLVNIPVTSNPLHIMHSSSSSCGTKSQPWRLEAPKGQQINVSLLDFSLKTTVDADTRSCQQYGYIADKEAKNNVSICRLTIERQKLVYRSKTNKVDIIMNLVHSNDTQENKLTFLIQVIAVGCSDLVPPEDAWLRRTDNEAVIGCYTSRQEWHLHCVGSHWVGVIGNCTLGSNEKHIEEPTPSMTIPVIGNPNQVLVILALGFLALIVCVTVICCGAVFLRRYYATAAQKQWRKVEEIENLKRFNGTASVNPITMNGHVDI